MKLETGTNLGSYELLALAGAGGMGEVYRARDMRLGREVAIKILPEAVASDPDRLARFEREARTVATLNHPNIVVLYSVEHVNAVRFLTMEYVDGQGLDRLVAPGGLPLERVLSLAIPLADALAAAHQRGIVHRDLKPANVMVTKEGRVKVLDFGLAKQAMVTLTDTGAALDSATRATPPSPVSAVGQVMGTGPYMAPEQWRGEVVDARTDLFAFGIILYELATGRRPFGGVTSVDMSSAILRDAPPPLQSIRADAPADLQRVVSRCLEKDLERRFQTAKDVRNELELIQRALVPSTPPPSHITPSQPAHSSPAVQAKDGASIAVLPFVNRGRNEEDEYFADGLADELMNVLGKVRGLRVAARTSSHFFKGKSEDLSVIGQKLNVATLLEGSVRKAGNRVRISVQLIKVADGFQLWSEVYDRTLDDIFALQEDIAQSVVKELRTTLMGEEPDSKASGEARAAVEHAAKGRGENAEAYQLYLQGRFFVDRYTKEDVAKGAGYLEQALRIDPNFALAWALLGRARYMQAGYGWVLNAGGFEGARAAVLKAIILEPNLAEGHVALSLIQSDFDWDWKSAEESLRRALKISPNNVEALRNAGALAASFSRLEQGLEYVRRALVLDPLSASTYGSMGEIYRQADRLDDARDAFRKMLELSPQRVLAHCSLALILSGQGHLEEAVKEAEKEPEDYARLMGLAIVHGLAGRKEQSDQALNELITTRGHDAAYQIALIYSSRGEIDAAFEWLERAYTGRDPGLAAVAPEPIFRKLYSDSRWPSFLRKIGFLE